jgi:hypothetical protein
VTDEELAWTRGDAVALTPIRTAATSTDATTRTVLWVFVSGIDIRNEPSKRAHRKERDALWLPRRRLHRFGAFPQPIAPGYRRA